jgi:hypothetical protein
VDARRIHDRAQRLERGTFTFPARVAEGVASVAIDVHELAVLLERVTHPVVLVRPQAGYAALAEVTP